jgi:hypothetical protein
VCFVVHHSSQDHLRIGTHDLDHHRSCQCKNTNINHFIILETCGKHRRVDPLLRLCSLGYSVSLLLKGFTKSSTPWVSSPFLIRGPNPTLPCVTALHQKRRRHEHAFSWLPSELCLTSGAGDSTAGLLLTSWQAMHTATLPWIILIHPGASQARALQDGKCHFRMECQEKPNYNILLEWMAYYSRYATEKKNVILGFLVLQWDTSKPEAIAIPEAQPTQTLPCSGTSWFLALCHTLKLVN